MNKNKQDKMKSDLTQCTNAQYRPFVDSQTGERIAGIFSGGKSDSIGSNTPSLKRPDSDYSRILAILREMGAKGLTTQEITAEFNKRHGTKKTMFVMSSKLGRLASKKLVDGRPKPDDKGVTLWFLYGKVV